METWSINEFFYLGMDRGILSPRKYEGNGLRINLGGGTKQMPTGVMNLGFAEGWDGESGVLPFADGSVGEIWALHFFEHIRNLVPLLRECQRVLEPGGLLNIVVPYGASHIAVQDITHVRMFNEDTWQTLFRNKYYAAELGEWAFNVESNFIMAIVERNMALFTQLVRQR